MNDRLKDPHDFYAFPVYFFREIKHHQSLKTNEKKKRSKKLQKVTSEKDFSNEDSL
jgi:hypothetical protein